MIKAFTFVSVLLFLSNIQAQTIIWSEDFSSYPDGIVAGSNLNVANPSADWTSGGCVSCAGNSGDWWEVRSGRMEAHDVNDDHSSLITEAIDISGHAAVYFSVLCTESGDHEGLYYSTVNCADQSSQDYVDVEYRIDGGSWLLVSNYLGWCGLYGSCGAHTLYGDDGSASDCRSSDNDWGSTTIQVHGLTGLSLELRFSATNSSGSEYIQFDNILVVGYDPLPVELTRLEAKQQGRKVELVWSTATEINNDRFEVERSNDGKIWEMISEVKGVGNSQVMQEYQVYDEFPLSGISYYRLNQVDFDGKNEYSKIKTVDFHYESLCFEIVPNPSSQSISILGEDLGNSEIQIFNSIGESVFQSSLANTRINISEFKSGIYFVQLLKEGKSKIKKLVVID